MDSDYCPNCGQKRLDLSRPFPELVGDVVKEAVDIDGRAFRTLKSLILRPGQLTREYLDGRRRLYSPPLRLYLVVSVSFFVMVAWLAGRGVLLDPGQTAASDAERQAQFMANDLPRMMFVLLPVFAVMLKIFYIRRYYFDHLIFSLHLHTAAYLLLALMLPLEDIADGHQTLLIAHVFVLGCFLLYLLVSLHRVYSDSWIAATVKSVAILLGYLVIVGLSIEAGSNMRIFSD